MSLAGDLGLRRTARRAARRSRRASRRANAAVSGYELVAVGFGAAHQLAAGASGTWTVRAQKDQIPVDVYIGCTVPSDGTITDWSIAGKRVMRSSGAVAVGSYQPKNTTRPGSQWPAWKGGTDLVITVKNNHGASERVFTGVAFVLRKKD